MLSNMSARDNYFRLLCLTFETATFIIRKLMEQYLNRTKISLKQLIDKYQHEIFHFYSDKTCCLCKKNKLKSKSVIGRDQMLKLFDTGSTAKRLNGHSYKKTEDLCCCFGQQNISVGSLDFTLLRFLLINFCEDEFWEIHLKQYRNFEDFLNNEKHTMFHLWQPKFACCQCRTGYAAPKENFLTQNRFRIMYRCVNIPNGSCMLNDTCNYVAEHGLTYHDIKNTDKVLFNSITNFFCLNRKAIDTIAKIRNEKLAHVESPDVSNIEYEFLWNSLENSIIEIARSTNSVVEATQRIEHHKFNDLDMNMCEQWRNKLILEIAISQDISQYLQNLKRDNDFDHQVLDAKLDTLLESNKIFMELCGRVNSFVKTETSTRDRCVDTDVVTKDLNRQHTNHNISENVTNEIKPNSAQQPPKALIDDVLAIVKETDGDLQDYIVCSIEVTFKKKQIQRYQQSCTDRQNRTSITNNSEFHIIDSPAVYDFYRKIKGMLTYLFVFTWHKDVPFDVEDQAIQMEVNNESDEDTDEGEQDTHICGKCHDEFHTLDRFVHHKTKCMAKARHHPKKAQLPTKDTDVLQVRMTFDRNDSSWERVVERREKLLNIDTNNEGTSLDFIEKGSLVLWTKMASSTVKNKQSFVKNVDDFVFKVISKCPIQTDEETTLKIKIDILNEIRDYANDEADIFRCGKCKIEFNVIEEFCSHKRHCKKRRIISNSSKQHISLENATNASKELISIQNMEMISEEHQDQMVTTENMFIDMGRYEATVEKIKDPLLAEDKGPEKNQENCRGDNNNRMAYENDEISDDTITETNLSLLLENCCTLHGVPNTIDENDDTNKSVISESKDSGIVLFNALSAHSSEYAGSVMSEAESIATDSEIDDDGFIDYSEIDVRDKRINANIKYKKRDNYYEKCKTYFQQHTYSTAAKSGLDLSVDCINRISSTTFLKVKDHIENCYENYITDSAKLMQLCQSQPNKFIRGVFRIESQVNAFCIPSERTEDTHMVVKLQGPDKWGKAFNDDEVVVEILSDDPQKCNLHREKNMLGRVIGTLTRYRFENIDHPIFTCAIDTFEPDLAMPVCKTISKLQLIQEDNITEKECVHVYSCKDKNLQFSDSVSVDKCTNSLFCVVLLSWNKHLLPLGAVVEVLPKFDNYIRSIDILERQFCVPTGYKYETIKSVDEMSTDIPKEMKAGRVDYTHLEVFLINKQQSTCFNHALSIDCPTDIKEYVVGVHISDVASIVHLNSNIDKEAFARGTTFLEGQFLKPRYMIPEPLSEGVCSIQEGKESLTLTVLLHFNSSKDIVFEKTEFCKSYVKPCATFSYKEIGEIISSESEGRLENNVKTLFEISKAVRKTRLGKAVFAVPVKIDLTGESNVHCLDADILLKEFLILTNYVVAIKLATHFPLCVPLYCQDIPPIKEVKRWLETYPVTTDLLLELQGKYPTSARCLDMFNLTVQIRPNDLIALQKWVWKSLSNFINDKKFDSAKRLIAKDKLHPFQAIALNDWNKLQKKVEFRCLSSAASKDECTFFKLGIFPYVQITEPLHCYMDIVTQRLLLSAIENKPSPYAKEEVVTTCLHINRAIEKRRMFKSRCNEVIFANSLSTQPFMTHGFVQCFEPAIDRFQTKIKMYFPGLEFLQDCNKVVLLSFLHLSVAPEIKRDVDLKRTTRDSLLVKWKKRIYSVTEAPTKPKRYISRHGKYQSIDPHQKAFHLRTMTWLDYLASGTTQNQRSLKTFEDNGVRKYLQSTFSTVNDITSEMNMNVHLDSQPNNVVFAEQFSKFSLLFSLGQVLSVQLSSTTTNGMLAPTIDFLEITKNVKLCLKHTRDPASCLAPVCGKRAKEVYSSSEEYKQIWSEIISLESSLSAVTRSGIIINDVEINFQLRTGYFSLKEDFCFKRNIDLSMTTSYFPNSQTSRQTNASTSVSDYLCIRCQMKYDENEQFWGYGLRAKYYYWISHAKITKIDLPEEDQQRHGLIVHFELVGEEVPEVIRYKETGIKCCVELIQRTKCDKRMEVMIGYLNKAEALAKAIALQRKPPALDTFVQLDSKFDVDLRLPPNNKTQNQAIQRALRSTFTVIHGPPGTGKTTVGIKLVYLYCKINELLSKEENGKKRKILFCTPSNKSLDNVARYLMRISTDDGPSIVRYYGDEADQQFFKIPGEVIVSEAETREPERDMKIISAHNLIRETGNYADQIVNFEKDFNKNHTNVNFRNVQTYKTLVREATIDLLEKYDVLLCTTAVATSPVVINALKNNLSQLIIDDSGMCTEPECITAIIATQPKQVILIGDHKELKPVVKCRKAALLGLDVSLLERYKDTAVQLNIQYRMHDSICQFPSMRFYDGLLETADIIKSDIENHELSIWLTNNDKYRSERYLFIHVDGQEEVVSAAENRSSYLNITEVNQVVKIFRHLSNVDNIFEKGNKLAILSQHEAQCNAIKKALAHENLSQTDITTVASFQGAECDYLIFSLVRSLPEHCLEHHPSREWCSENLGDITDHNHLNYAITRAKKGLFIIGNKHLLACDEAWRDLLNFYDRTRCIVDGKLFLCV